MTFQPSGLPSWVQSLGSTRPLKASLILVTVASTSVRRDLLERRGRRDVDRIAADDVEVDLEGAARPAGLGRADRLPDRRPAVRRLGLREQAEVDERLAGVDREELWREPVIRRDEGDRVAAGEVARQRQGLVGLLVGRRG